MIARVLILAGLAMLAYYYGTGVYTAGRQNQLRRDWQNIKKSDAGTTKKTQGSTDTAGRPDLSDGDIFGRIVIPKLDVDMIVLEGAGRSNLTKGPAHITATSWPSQGGNTAVSAHRTTFAAPFRHLDQLKNGDLIKLITLRGQYRYRVTGRDSVRPTETAVIGQTWGDRLTLITCDPPGSAVRRLAVWAELVP